MIELTPRYLSLRDATRRYGTSKSTLYLLIQRRDIRAIKFGGRTLVHVASADAFFDAQPTWMPGWQKVLLKASSESGK
jgi:excisionase family DNA binding protein